MLGGGLIRSDVPTMLYIIFKTIKPATSVSVYNLKYEIYKATIANFGNNVKYLLGDMYSDYSIIIIQVEQIEIEDMHFQAQGCFGMEGI